MLLSYGKIRHGIIIEECARTRFMMLKSLLSRPLWQKIFCGFILGIIFGLALGPRAVMLKPIGDVYLNLVRMIVVPLVFFTISSSIAQLSESKNITRLFLRTMAWFLIGSSLAVMVGILFGHLIGPGLGLGHLPLGEYKAQDIPSALEVFIGLIPANPIAAMANANIMQVLFFSAMIGAALASLGAKAQNLRTLMFEGTNLIFVITRWILQLTPLGTFGLIAWVVGHYGLSSLFPLGKFIIAMYAACTFHMIVVYGGLLKLHGLKMRRFFRSSFPAQQMAFASCSSMATLPLALNTAINKLGVPKDLAQFALPLGASVKMDGCGAIYPAIAAIFVAQYFGLELTFSHYALIAITAIIGAVGTAGVPGTSIVLLTLTLKSVGLPLEGLGYLVAIDRIIDMIRTTTNVTGQMLVPVLVAKEERILNEEIYNGVFDDLATETSSTA